MNKLYLLSCLILSGCTTLTPAMAGKTHYNVEFIDQTNEQNTQYKMNIKAPAGVDLAAVTGMTYDWDVDGNGSISVSSDSKVNTEAQVKALIEVNAQQAAALVESLNIIKDLMPPTSVVPPLPRIK